MRNWTLFTACFFFFKQKTAYEMRISDWSSDVCSSDLVARGAARLALHGGGGLALALLGRLLVVLALAGFGQHAGLLAGALEAAQGKLERLVRSEEHTSELQSLMRISYAVFCLKKKKKQLQTSQ